MSSQAHVTGTTEGAGIVTKVSTRSVGDTVARLSAIMAEKGLKLLAIIDHDAEAAANGLQLRETKLVIFGSPIAGTPVMDAHPLAALDLPLKVLVWADADQTKVSYVGTEELVARYGLSEALAARLGAIDPLTDSLIES